MNSLGLYISWLVEVAFLEPCQTRQKLNCTYQNVKLLLGNQARSSLNMETLN